LALHDAEENPDEVLATLDDKTEAVIRELEAQRGNPMEALRCVPICTRPQDEEAVRQWCGDIGAAG
jgi:hypothetical protein